MCYSAEVSFGTWALGMLSALFLMKTGSSLQSIAFPLAVTQMQLVEGLRWIHAVDERWLAVLGKVVLGLQPVAGLYGAGVPQYSLPYLLVQGLLELVYGSRDLRFTVAPDGHFRWRWLESDSFLPTIAYWIPLAYAALRILPLGLNLLLLGLYIYYSVLHGEFKTEGSLWCVSVNILWIYYLLR